MIVTCQMLRRHTTVRNIFEQLALAKVRDGCSLDIFWQCGFNYGLPTDIAEVGVASRWHALKIMGTHQVECYGDVPSCGYIPLLSERAFCSLDVNFENYGVLEIKQTNLDNISIHSFSSDYPAQTCRHKNVGLRLDRSVAGKLCTICRGNLVKGRRVSSCCQNPVCPQKLIVCICG